MTIDDKIRDEKLQYDINREAANISALSSNKIDKYEYLTGEEILPCNQRQIIEKAKFTYFSLEKAFESLKNKQKRLMKRKEKNKLKRLENKKKNKIIIIIIIIIKNKSSRKQKQKKFSDTDEKSVASLFSKAFLTEDSYELNKIAEMENKLKRDDLIYKTGNKKKNKTYDF